MGLSMEQRLQRLVHGRETGSMTTKNKHNLKNTTIPRRPIDTSRGKDWPESVPILGPNDFCEGSYGNGRGQFCLLGHCNKTFTSPVDRGVVRRALHVRILQLDGEHISIFNDLYSTRGLRAKLWNSVMADLGYMEGNPEADRPAQDVGWYLKRA